MDTPLNRRGLLPIVGLGAVGAAVPTCIRSAVAQTATNEPTPPPARADHTIRIGRSLVELAPDHIVSTTTYNGQFPRPLLRFKDGQRVTVDARTDTNQSELLRWHGQ